MAGLMFSLLMCFVIGASHGQQTNNGSFGVNIVGEYVQTVVEGQRYEIECRSVQTQHPTYEWIADNGPVVGDWPGKYPVVQGTRLIIEKVYELRHRYRFHTCKVTDNGIEQTGAVLVKVIRMANGPSIVGSEQYSVTIGDNLILGCAAGKWGRVDGEIPEGWTATQNLAVVNYQHQDAGHYYCDKEENGVPVSRHLFTLTTAYNFGVSIVGGSTQIFVEGERIEIQCKGVMTQNPTYEWVFTHGNYSIGSPRGTRSLGPGAKLVIEKASKSRHHGHTHTCKVTDNGVVKAGVVTIEVIPAETQNSTRRHRRSIVRRSAVIDD